MMTSFKTFCALIQRDMAVFKEELFDRIINSMIWVILYTWVFEYLFPLAETVSKEYGLFIACGNIICIGHFEVMQNATNLISNLEGSQSLSYELTLPLPHWLVFSRIAISNMLQAMIMSIAAFLSLKLVFWSQFDLARIHWPWFIGIFIIVNAFYGFFSLYLASVITSINQSQNVWMRIIYPMWWLGGYQFSYATFTTVAPIIAKISLLNPMIYIFEGARSAMLGGNEYIHVSYCIAALFIFTLIVGYIGTRRMIKRLDCI